VHLGGVDALAGEVLGGAALRREQQVRELVGEQAVELFGHGAVAAAQAGLHVRHGDVQLGRAERGGEGGVDVADDDHEVGAFLEEHRLEALEDVRRLGRM
jgi:hypothetical protein